MYAPKRIFILAGTNDILGQRPFDPHQFQTDYINLLNRSQKTGAQIFVTLIPLTINDEWNLQIKTANEVIRPLAQSRKIPLIDLNPTLAPHGKLLPQYTVDGVHLSSEAYKIWRQEIKNLVAEESPVSGADA